MAIRGMGKPAPAGPGLVPVRADRGRAGRWLVPLAVGAMFLALGLVVGIATGVPSRMTATAAGSVLSVRSSFSGGVHQKAPACSPIVVYAVHGRRYVAYSGNSQQSPCPYRVGQQLTVHYDPASPAEGRIGPTVESSLLSLGFVVIGALVLIAVAVPRARSRWWSPTALDRRG